MGMLLVSIIILFHDIRCTRTVFHDNPDHPTRHAISAGPFPAGVKYRLIQAHWHWGISNNGGSEHKVDGVSYPIELHMVHYNEKYKDQEEAFKHPDGAVVFTFFYKVLRVA